ncbi:hypothetical protein CEXT_316181 [Caerostris extrusa]|uniref:Uncharacterized protein n=1 Tax=Caerostris extrusa TaxID=172846 RepID=A0AAV4MMG8_CAEEX|nr:hypothetical protein CEXT_316181 [Caerostris extrusa]
MIDGGDLSSRSNEPFILFEKHNFKDLTTSSRKKKSLILLGSTEELGCEADCIPEIVATLLFSACHLTGDMHHSETSPRASMWRNVSFLTH